jgi:hypothetical protein
MVGYKKYYGKLKRFEKEYICLLANFSMLLACILLPQLSILPLPVL